MPKPKSELKIALDTVQPTSLEAQTKRPDGVINITDQQWGQSAGAPFYLKLDQVYDLEEGNFQQWKVSTSPAGVTYAKAGTFAGPVYLYVTINLNLPTTSGLIITPE